MNNALPLTRGNYTLSSEKSGIDIGVHYLDCPAQRDPKVAR